jgi:methylated-DNA-[protein]-cysteine S-methyltransferase
VIAEARAAASADAALLYATISSPLGELLVVGDGESLRALHLQAGSRPGAIGESWRRADQPFAAVRDQLDQYFAGERSVFELALAPSGTPFQDRVWRELQRIPYGQAISYSELARRVGRPTAARAAGAANARNPISILIPCHRVVGAGGGLSGYAGGIERKRRLLEFERGERAVDGCSSPNGWINTPLTGRFRLVPRGAESGG